jgi:hypothetical protein
MVNAKLSLRKSARATLVLAFMSAMGTLALAANPPPNASPTVTKETREKMATVHEQMAACLRSDKSMSDCHTEMKKSCQEVFGDQGCPMTGMGKHSHGMHQPPANNTEKPKS